LPYHVAAAVGFGLPADEGLKAITLYPAQILGVADRVGSLETGKDATLFVSDGDPLETPTQVTHAWVRGRKVDLNDRHKTLYHKYEQKYEQQR
jgi:imidazolonepropionase-like amidohydrolase